MGGVEVRGLKLMIPHISVIVIPFFCHPAASRRDLLLISSEIRFVPGAPYIALFAMCGRDAYSVEI